MANKKSIGLPGGPNEYITDISEYLSIEGYKFNSPDVDNPFNIIESGSITMEDVEFPVLGTDNLGNSQMMQPGMNYEFPGDQVFEIPMAQEGNVGERVVDRSRSDNALMVNAANSLYNNMYSNDVNDANMNRLLFEQIRPEGYPSISGLAGAGWRDYFGKEGKPPVLDKDGSYSIDEEAWAKALGLPNDAKYFIPSEYMPSDAKNPNDKYVKLNPDVIDWNKLIKHMGDYDKGDDNKTEGKKKFVEGLSRFIKDDFMDADDFYGRDPLQGFQLQWGYDNERKEKYLSIYDKYDFRGVDTENIVKPFEIYDRIYVEENKDSGEYIPKAQKGGGSVSWNWKGKSYSGTLIPSMENENNRYARTKNGKVKTLPKGQMGNLGSYPIKEEKEELINKLNSETFLNRYVANYKHVTGKDIDIELAKKNVKNQIDFTNAGSDNAIVYPYTGSENEATTYSPYYGDGSGDSTQIKRDNAIASFETRPFQYGDDRKLASDIISKDAYNYPYSIGLQYDNSGNIRTNYGDPLKGLLRHELAHSYNTNTSPLFDDMIDDPTNRVTVDGKQKYRTNMGHYNAEGSLLKVYEDLFGKENFKDFNMHAGMPAEISSAKAETEGRLLDEGIWDYNKEKFGSSQFEKMLNTNEKLVPNNSEAQLHFQSMEFSNLKGMMNDLKNFDKNDNKRKLRDVYDEGYNVSTFDEQDSFYDSWLQDNKRYSFEDGPYGDKSPYQNAKYLLKNSKTKRGKKYNKALEFVEGVDNIQNIADQKSIIDYRKGLENDINDLRPEVERKMKIYFNELVQENNPNQPVMAQQGYEFRQGDENLFQKEIFDYKNFADKLASPFTAFGYSARNEPIPKGLNVSNPERNNLDMLVDVFNPFAWAQYAENSKRDFEEGEILSGSLNALGAIPVIPAWLSRAKIGELPKMINKLINPKAPSLIKDQVKKYSGNTPRNLDDITPVKGVRPPHIGRGGADIMPEGSNLQKPLQQLAAGADSFRATIQKRLNDLKPGSEGFERLVEAEAKYLQSVGQPYNKVFAERNALARYNELVSAKGNTINDNALAMWKDAIGDPKHVNHNIARELFKNNDGLYFNAWFQNAPRKAVYETGDFVPKKYLDPVTGVEMPFPDELYNKYLADPNMVINLKRLGKESIPGKVTTGMKYSNNAPVEVHELNHLLQAGRKMPLDDYARKLTPSANLSKTGKAQWEYFKEGSSGQEPTSYLAELRQSMLDRGIIKNIYDKITPNKLIQAEVSFANKPRGFYDYGWDRGGKNSGFLSNTRVLDLYEKTAKNREILSRALNKLPAAIPVVGASTALSQEQDGGFIPSRSQIIVSEDEQNKKNNQVLGLTNIIDYMVESRGGNEKTWTDLADNIAFHESGPQQRMNPLARQITKDGEKDGLGRGMFQFEPESFDTAKTRYKNVAEAAGKKTGIKYTLNENILNAESALDLSAKDQYTLFFANLIESPAVLKDYADGKLSMADVWLKGHKNVSKKGNRKSFANSMEAAKKELGKTGFLQFSLEDLLPYKKGGESEMLNTYKNYINGKVKSQEANNIYDKLNRIHLNDARRMGMSVPNYIMTHL